MWKCEIYSNVNNEAGEKVGNDTDEKKLSEIYVDEKYNKQIHFWPNKTFEFI